MLGTEGMNEPRFRIWHKKRGGLGFLVESLLLDCSLGKMRLSAYPPAFLVVYRSIAWRAVIIIAWAGVIL